ncbi:MAG TPA: efflux RND transporter permease subunit, partial [Pseudohongiella sp.]|nr:efflux RND transporter permease subunit [Pseudohongiella sp.]
TMGAVPLMLAEGAGSESRSLLGTVIFSGVSMTTLLTLFVVPVMYDLIARNTGSPQRVSRLLASLQSTYTEAAASTSAHDSLGHGAGAETRTVSQRRDEI